MKYWILCLALILPFNSIAQEKPISFPAFHLKSISGNKAITQDIFKKNSLTLISFWASWCSPCIKEFPELEKFQKKYKALGFKVLGVNVDDSIQLAQKSLSQHAPQLVSIYDKDQRLLDLLNISSMPYNILVNSKGEILRRLTGYSQKNQNFLHHYLQAYFSTSPKRTIASDK